MCTLLLRLTTLRKATVRHCVGTAWGLAKEKALSPPASALKHLTVAQQCREVCAHAAEAEEENTRLKRVPASTIRVQHSSGTDEPATDMDRLTTMVEEQGHCDLARGTKRALVGGGGALNGLLAQLRYDPQLELPGGSWILTALPDIWKKLKAASKKFR